MSIWSEKSLCCLHANNRTRIEQEVVLVPHFDIEHLTRYLNKINLVPHS